mgnify:CR=1 FL=1
MRPSRLREIFEDSCAMSRDIWTRESWQLSLGFHILLLDEMKRVVPAESTKRKAEAIDKGFGF